MNRNETVKHFEEDVGRMFKWISDNMELFMSKCTRIGRTTSETSDLEQEHGNFFSKSMQTQVHVMRLHEVAERLSADNPYAAGRVSVRWSRLERSWLQFQSCQEERTAVLQMTGLFYQKAESFIANVPAWSQELELAHLPLPIPDPGTNAPSPTTRLEELVARNDNLWHNIHALYEDAHAIRKKLTNQLQHFIQFCHQVKADVLSNLTGQQVLSQQQQQQSSSKRTAASDYEEASKHVSFTMHEVMSGYRALESIWQMRRVKLHQKIALALFQEDVRQVLDWIEVHGEGFLRKNMTIGRNAGRARALQKSHQHFEAVAKNTYSNGEKLLAAAEEFAQTGECNPDEIYRVAHLLQQRVQSFVEKVERRRIVLNLAAMFFTHEREIANCIQALRSEVQENSPMQAPGTVEACERALQQVALHKDELMDAINTTVSEGRTLADYVRLMMDSLPPDSESSMQQQQSLRSESPTDQSSSSSSSCARNTRLSLSQSLEAVEGMMQRLEESRSEVEDLCHNRKIRMELCLQLRVFERDARTICHRFMDFAKEMESTSLSETTTLTSSTSTGSPSPTPQQLNPSSAAIMQMDAGQADKALQVHNDKFNYVQKMACDFFQRGQELAQVCTSFLYYCNVLLRGETMRLSFSLVSRCLPPYFPGRVFACRFFGCRRRTQSHGPSF